MAIPDDSDARTRAQVDEPTVASHEVDLAVAFEWLDALQRHVGKLERLVEVVTAARADIAAIAECLDPALRDHLAELDAKLERHDLLLARLLEKVGDDTT
jgi:hypothetical protein